MSKPDFRALCQELMDAIDSGIPRGRIKQSPLAVRVDAALAQPEPQGFTPDHVNLMCFAFEREPWATWLRRGGCLESAHCELSDLMLAVLARWGRPAIEPVPVSERLPGPEDCDKEGCCWWWDYGQDSWSQGMPEYCINRHTHWLPHYALPVPGVEGADG